MMIQPQLMIMEGIANAFIKAIEFVVTKFLEAGENVLKSFFIPGTVRSLNDVNGILQNQTNEVVTNISKSPNDFVAGAYDTVTKIKDEVVVPVAIIIFAFIMTYELIGILTEKNNFKNFDTYDYARYAFIFIFGLILIDNTTKIIEIIVNLGIRLIDGANKILSTEVSTSFFANPVAIRQELESMASNNVIAIGFVTRILSFLLYALTYITLIVVIGRMFEIYIYIAISPIPVAFFFSHKLESTAIGFLKQLLALSLQGFMILLVISIYSSIINNLELKGGFLAMLGQIVVYSIVLVLSLFKTRSIAAKVLGA